MTVVFVTAIYNIHASRSNEIWNRFAHLAANIDIYIVCSEKDAARVPNGATPIFRELEDLQTFVCLAPFSKLPETRSVDKDTKEYMIVMNAKAECIQIVKHSVDANHYIWIDAGISKIFQNPQSIFEQIKEQTSVPLKPTHLFMPGCWRSKISDIHTLSNRIAWRFAGGFFIVPKDYVDLFAEQVLECCTRIGLETGVATWEVNVWCLLESTLPIQWAPADHNETIISGLKNYEETAPIPSHSEGA